MAVASPRISAMSPAGVDVACALMYPTSRGASFASFRHARTAFATPRPSGSGAAAWCASADMPMPASSQYMGAPRSSACSSDSSTRTAAPSPRTKPLRSAWNGRQVSAADLSPPSSLSSAPPARARMRWNPEMATASAQASAPPANAASARPRRIHIAASEIAAEPAAHAVADAASGPAAPYLTLTALAAALASTRGTKCGETRRLDAAPSTAMDAPYAAMSATLPMPLPMEHPSRESGSPSRPSRCAFLAASAAAKSAYAVKSACLRGSTPALASCPSGPGNCALCSVPRGTIAAVTFADSPPSACDMSELVDASCPAANPCAAYVSTNCGTACLLIPDVLDDLPSSSP
mmetsp:Transcript_11696/g.30929  ORF Transcript_11696/g.30929 Transcript_11696/m.30929 type:complete len:350 (-) Transcript_11696:97-1146(-)